jgi:glutamyl-tRNA synthetase
MKVRVRFAPSPTGNLHIGSVRTALFNYLFARHHSGKFLIRIEDTDKERSKKEYEEDILAGLNWLGMHSDEPLVYQAQRLERHKKYIDKLLAEGKAYKDKDTPAIYFRVPTEGETVIDDVVKGPIIFQNKDFKDQVILKSDGSVTYNFGVVIDDAEMAITHVIRGEDHISNTPKQIFFYQALGFNLPKFAHIPMILGPDRSKLSKRHGATSINEYRKQGYLPEALNNYLALLGWTPADSVELMSMDELITKFDLDRASKSNSIFDLQKLNWMNGQKIRGYAFNELLDKLQEFLPPQYKELLMADPAKAQQIFLAIKDNLELAGDFAKAVNVFFNQELNISAEDQETIKLSDSQKVLKVFIQKAEHLKLSANYEQNYELVHNLIEEILKESGLKKSQVLKPLRIAISGAHAGPGLKYLIVLLGLNTVVERIKQCVLA